MAAHPVSTTSTERARTAAGTGLSSGAIVLAAAIPLLFLHASFQPAVGLSTGSTTTDVTAADAAVAAVLVAAVLAARRHGFGQLRAGLALWLPAVLLALWLAFEALRPVALDDPARDAHVVTLLKAFEYGLLAVAVPLLCRYAADLTLLFTAVAAWGALAAVVGAAQFFGLDVFDAWPAGWRQPSFVGHHDLAALACLVLAGGSAVLLANRQRPVSSRLWAVLAAAALALVLSGSAVAAGGFACAAALVALAARRRLTVSWRRIGAVSALAAISVAGVLAVRADPLADFMRFLGVRDGERAQGIESYSHRTVLAYVGLRIFADRPLAGAGWQRSNEPPVFEPYVDDARRRFPNVVEEAFPAAERRWGVQNAYVQALAELGIIGFVLVVSVFAAGAALAWRAVGRVDEAWRAAPIGALGAIVALAALWAALGLVPGIPLQAATSLSLGLTAACAAVARDARG